jgi:hypothetical protein
MIALSTRPQSQLECNVRRGAAKDHNGKPELQGSRGWNPRFMRILRGRSPALSPHVPSLSYLILQRALRSSVLVDSAAHDTSRRDC